MAEIINPRKKKLVTEFKHSKDSLQYDAQRYAATIQNLNDQTPYMLVDLEGIKANCRLFKRKFPYVKLFYAVKALSDSAVIDAIKYEVDGFDVASVGEIAALVDLGVDPLTLAFSNPVKSPQAIKHAAELGVKNFAFQSECEVDKLAENAPACNVYLRVTMDDSGSEVPLSAKFGCTDQEIIPLLKYASEKGLNPIGFTFHVGSQATALESWSTAMKRSVGLCRLIKVAGFDVKQINIGGGFPAQYYFSDPELGAIAQEVSDGLHAVSDIPLVAEPGRVIVANAASIVASVIGIEHRNDQRWLYLDVGLFQAFIGAQRYDTFPYMPYSLKHAVSKDHEKVALIQSVVAGPSCDSQDVIIKDVWLPDDLEVGDKLVFPNTGAYTVTYGSNFNGINVPKRVYLDRQKKLRD